MGEGRQGLGRIEMDEKWGVIIDSRVCEMTSPN